MSDTPARNIDLQTLNARVADDAAAYAAAAPFPHAVFDGFLSPDVAQGLVDAFPPIEGSQWINYIHFNEKKHGLNKWDALPPAIADIMQQFNSEPFVAWLSKLTGIPNLKADEMLEGGGLHQSKPGGFLNIHADFLAHPHKPKWHRRVNVLLYLNPNWESSYGGALQLWSKDMKTCEAAVEPLFNRLVVFSTTKTSWHGFPDPITCPEGETRKSIALYYFTEEEKPLPLRTTDYRARPGSGFKAVFVWLDKKVLYLYSRVKRALGLSDDFASKILGMFGRKK